MSYSDILKIYNFDNYSCKCISNDKYHPSGHRILLSLFKDDNQLTTTNKEIVWLLQATIAHLDYIGFADKFRNQGILNKVHSNCIKVLSNSKTINRVTLKPILSAVTVWLYIGFAFEKLSQKDIFISTLVSWVDTHDIEYDIEKIEDDIISDTIKNLKEHLLLYAFPEFLEKEKYYISNLYKDVS